MTGIPGSVESSASAPAARAGGGRWRSKRRETIASRPLSLRTRSARWEVRVQAWSDPYASWLDEYDRKVAAGQADLGGELSEGVVLFGAGTVDEWRAAAAGRSDRERHGPSRGPVLGVDVERWLLRDLQAPVVYEDILTYLGDADAPFPSHAPPLLPVAQANR